MSLHVYHLKKSEPDQQFCPAYDEVDYVVKGTGKMTVANLTQERSEGDLVFVPHDVRHHWHHYEDLTRLVFFASAFTQGG